MDRLDPLSGSAEREYPVGQISDGCSVSGPEAPEKRENVYLLKQIRALQLGNDAKDKQIFHLTEQLKIEKDMRLNGELKYMALRELYNDLINRILRG